ncbi:hypothetical protein K466DRAFT_47821 [Polyporus arcularius HHB13444]|uniref:Uncharacterized protein n=1 Tax=Polyporus arcularius HHB13444 TaxID=1314778 RepID=A0A5C3PWI1_9APHY|nr:hypothetical protein K466DRAFT_47821 [Polyporus arcularius HHB13444]
MPGQCLLPAASSAVLTPPEQSRSECETYSLHFSGLIRYLSEGSQDTHRIRHHRRGHLPCLCLWRQPQGSILTFLCYIFYRFWPQPMQPSCAGVFALQATHPMRPSPPDRSRSGLASRVSYICTSRPGRPVTLIRG